MKNNKTASTTNQLKIKRGIGDRNSRIFVGASILLFLLVLFSVEKPKAQMLNQQDLIVNQVVKTSNQENLVVNKQDLIVNQEVQTSLATNQEDLLVNQDSLIVHKTAQITNKQDPSTNQAVRAVNQKTHNLIKQQIKSSFKQIPFKNLEPAPVNFWYQAELDNQVIYFSPTQELMFIGEVYTKNGYSLSEQTRRKWQAQKLARLDLGDAIIIGDGVIEVIEFSDTDCGFCRLFNRWIGAKNKAYKAKHGKDLFTRKIVLTPIDGLHPNAHREAVHILCQSNDKREAAINQALEKKIALSDMDSCQKGKDLLKTHRNIAQEFGVSATPILVINGQIVQGFNQQKLEAVVQQQLRKQQFNKNPVVNN